MVNYHNYNNVKFVINNQSILADSASFSVAPTLSAQEKMGQKGGFEYVADAGLKSNLSLGYYLVGADPLRPFLTNKSPITVEAGGLTLQNGYLNSYSLAGAPHGPVKVDVGLVFYEDFGGSFSPTVLPEADYNYLRLSDMIFTFQGMDATSRIKSMSYEMSCEVDPVYKAGGAGADAVYHAGSLVPEEIRFGRKTQTLRLNSYNFEEALPYVGKEVEFNFSLGPESFLVKGKLQSKNVNFTFGEKLVADFSLVTNSYGGAPVLRESNTGGTLSVGGYWYIYGLNLLDTTAVYFNNNIRANEFTTHTISDNGNDSYIKIKIPRFARSGPIRVITPYGEAAHEQRAGGAPIIADISPNYVP